MKIAVIATGGTIGSKRQEDGWITRNQEQPFEVIELYQQLSQSDSSVEFDCFMPYQILSENLSSVYIDLLITAVQECISTDCYDGILICHGTDTLQYTAAILGYVFAEEKIPICLISSNYPLGDTRANGLDNFHYGVETLTKGLSGVLVVYRNSDGCTYVHRGTRLLAHQTFEDDLYSIRQSYLGAYDKNGNWIQNFQTIQEEKVKAVPYHGLQEENKGVLWLRVYPGIVYPELPAETEAVLLESYHSGTIGISRSLQQLCETAKERRIPVYLIGAISDSEGYETIKEYKQLGITVLANAAPIAVYCKLWLELGMK